MRLLIAIVTGLAPAAVLACSLAQTPPNQAPVPDGGFPALNADAGTADAQRPSKPVLTEPVTTLVIGGCDGSGASCPQLDTFKVKVAVTDDFTSSSQLRYAASFGATSSEATAAPLSLLFSADFGDPGSIHAQLGLGKHRAETDFSRATLCFTVVAIDGSGNVSDRSDALCVDTVSETAATTKTTPGSPCGPLGCSSAGGIELAALALSGLLLLRRFSRP